MTTSVPTSPGVASPELSAAARALLDRRTALPTAARDAIPRRDRPEVAPLSAYQQRLWLFDQMHPGSAAYNRPRAFRVTGPLDADALERALCSVVARHEVLRSVLLLEDGVAVQQARDVRISLPLVDLTSLASEVRAQRSAEIMRDEALGSFDLATGPLLRSLLVRTDDAEHALVITMHHAASDGWSDAVLYRELGAAYDACVHGADPALPPLLVQYGDFAAWQRERIASGALAGDLAFWTQRIAAAPPELELPTDRPRRPEQSFEGGTRRLRIPREETNALVALARGEKATLAMALLAVYQLLLSRYSGQTDVIVGLPIAGRTRPELEPLIGFFSNTLLLRGDLGDDPSFRELLQRVRTESIHAYAHQELPVDALIDALRASAPGTAERDLPVVRAMLNVRNTPPATLALTGTHVEPLELAAERAVVDLNLEITEESGELACIAEYATGLFDAATIDRMLAHFHRLVAIAGTMPDVPVSRLPLLTPAERHRASVTWNATDQPLGYETTLYELIDAQAARTPDAIAVSDDREALSYATLLHNANRLAAELQRRGVGAESLVAVCMERSVYLSVALLAVLKAGAAYVPLDPFFPTDRLDFMLEDAQPVLLLADRESAERVAGGAAGLEHLVVDAKYCDSLANASPHHVATPDGLAYVIYTSGSTGRPKGVLNTHRAICNRLLWMQDEYALGPDDVVLQKTPISFDVSVWELFWPLLTGARLVMARPEGHLDTQYLASVIAAARVTTVHFVPPMLQRFLDEADLKSCASLRNVICSGEALPLAVARRFADRLPHVGLHNLYGPTEAAVDVSYWRFDASSPRTTVPIGRPIANVQLHVLDAHMEPIPVGVAGELYIGGIAVARGYLNRPELTAQRFVPDPFSSRPGARLYRTGDVVRQDVHGVIDYLGRIDNQVKIQGVRIELGEVEAVLASHPAVRECVVTAAETPSGERRLVAYVVLRGDDAVREQELRDHMRTHLPEVLVPSVFVRLDAMPLTPSGKSDRRALPTPVFGSDAGPIAYRAPRTPTEVMLASIWCDVLNLPRVGVFDDFFALGGHSLEAARVMGRLRTLLGVSVPIRAIFEHPTIAELAPMVAAQDTTPRTPLVCMQRGDPHRAPLFLLHGDFNGGGLYCRALVQHLDPGCPVYTLYPHEPGTRDSIEEMAADYVERIRHAAPGPYLLAGYCNGASVAYEIARRLRSLGEDVALLALIDAAAPHPVLAAMHRVMHGGGHALGVDADRTRDAYCRAREHLFRLSDLLPPRDPRPSIPEWGSGVARIVRSASAGAARRVRRALLSTDDSEPVAALDSPAQISDAAALLEQRSTWYLARVRDYSPRRFDGRITLIQPAARVRRRTEDVTFNWTRLTRGVEMHVLPGSHLTIVGDGLDALGATLRQSIDAAVGQH